MKKPVRISGLLGRQPTVTCHKPSSRLPLHTVLSVWPVVIFPASEQKTCLWLVVNIKLAGIELVTAPKQ